MAFCRSRQTFHADELRRHVMEVTGIAAPASADRVLPQVPQPTLLAAVAAYRVVLEVVPLLVALTLFGGYELWWKLPRQRRRAAALQAAAEAARRDE